MLLVSMIPGYASTTPAVFFNECEASWPPWKWELAPAPRDLLVGLSVYHKNFRGGSGTVEQPYKIIRRQGVGIGIASGVGHARIDDVALYSRGAHCGIVESHSCCVSGVRWFMKRII